MAKRIIYFIGTILVMVLILTIYFLYCSSWFINFTISKELYPFDILSLIITLIMAVFLAWYITKKLSEERYKKEFVISDLIKIEEEINYIEKITSQLNKIELLPIFEVSNKINIYIERFTKTIKVLNISCKEVKKLHYYQLTLFEKITNTESSELLVDSKNRIEISQICSEFIIETRKIIHNINKQ